MKRSGSSSRSRNRVVWNEQNLDFLEANKTPKQKINEPKTPYYAPEPEDDVWPAGLVSPSPTDEPVQMKDDSNHAAQAEELRNKLSELPTSSDPEAGTSERNSEWVTSSEDEAEEMDHDDEGFEMNGRRWSFEEHRRAHYDEYRKAKMLVGHEMSDEEAEMGGGGGGGGGGDDGERHLGARGGGSCSRQSQQDHESSLSRSLGDKPE